MPLTLGDLVSQSELGLEMVVGPDSAFDRPVLGAHSIEIADPMRFLRADWVMLCNGLRLKNSPVEQRTLVAELQHGRITALGFGLGECFQRLPPALLEEARARDFPLFVIKGPTPFREIIGYVSQSNLDHGVYNLRRAMALQDELMNCLQDPAPDEAITRRLGELLQGSALLFSRTGEVQHAFGGASPADVWRLVASDSRTISEVEFDDGRAWLTPIIVEGRPHRWLALTAPEPGMSEPLVRRVVHTAQRLLELLITGRHSAATELRGAGERFLTRLLDDRAARIDAGTVARARTLGLPFEASVRVYAFRPCGPPPADDHGHRSTDVARERLERRLDWTQLPYLSIARGDVVAVLLEGELDDLEGIVADLAEQGHPFRVGVGSSATDLHRVRDSFRDSLLALDHAGRSPGPGAVRVEALGLAASIISDVPDEALARRVDAVLAPLKAHPALFETLVAYLKCDLDVGRTARALHLHANSLRYRLARIEQVLDVSLSHVPTIADLHLATVADAVVDRPD